MIKLGRLKTFNILPLFYFNFRIKELMIFVSVLYELSIFFYNLDIHLDSLISVS